MHHTLFISDLHLQPERPDITQFFLNFLKTQAPAADALYILGDLFEAWVGHDDNPDFNQSITSAILELTKSGTPVYFMRGNRDFLIGRQFTYETGCQLLTDPSVIDLYGTRLLLTHGDALCTQDTKHQKFRKFTQNRYNFLFLKFPLFLRRVVARLLRNSSRKHTRQLNYDVMDVTDTAVENMMRNHYAYILIHGHTHRPNIHSLMINGQPAYRIVLGDWEKKANALVFQESGEYYFID